MANKLLDTNLHRSPRPPKKRRNCIRDPSTQDFQSRLEIISKYYNITTQIKSAMNKLMETNSFQYGSVKQNLALLVDYCNRNFGENFIKLAIGASYDIKDPICWRYSNNGKKTWVVEELKQFDMNGTVDIKLAKSGNIKASSIFVKRRVVRL